MIRIPLPVLGFLVVALVPGDSSSQEIVVPGVSERAATPDPSATRPIGAYESVFIEELTWMEVRDAFRAGHTTVIVPTGGVSRTGPICRRGSTTTSFAVLPKPLLGALGTHLWPQSSLLFRRGASLLRLTTCFTLARSP